MLRFDVSRLPIFMRPFFPCRPCVNSCLKSTNRCTGEPTAGCVQTFASPCGSASSKNYFTGLEPKVGFAHLGAAQLVSEGGAERWRGSSRRPFYGPPAVCKCSRHTALPAKMRGAVPRARHSGGPERNSRADRYRKVVQRPEGLWFYPASGWGPRCVRPHQRSRACGPRWPEGRSEDLLRDRH